MTNYYSAWPKASSGQTLFQNIYGLFTTHTRLLVLMICLVAGLGRSGEVRGQTYANFDISNSQFGGLIPPGTACASTNNFWITSLSVNGSPALNYTGGTCVGEAPSAGFSQGIFTSLSATVQQGLAYDFVVNRNGSAYVTNMAIWIDYNDDGTFATTERLMNVNLPASGANTATVNGFVIPLNAPIGGGNTVGSHRMRVVSVYNNTDPTAAGSSSAQGEAKDFTIIITAATPCVGAPAVASVSPSSSSKCSGTTNTLSLTGLTPAGGYTYQWKVASSSGGSYSNAAGTSTNSTYTTPATLPFATSYYICEVTCSGNTTPSGEASVATSQFLTCYCSAAFTSGTQSNRGITAVTLNGNPALSNTGTSATSTYTDYTGLTPSGITVGQSYTLATTSGTQNTQNYRVAWIDYNQNGVYEASEVLQIVSTSGTHSNSVLNMNFTVPADAVPGITGMRIRSRYSSTMTASNACTSFASSGETEDYRVSIISGCDAPTANVSAVTTPTLTTTSATLSWTNGDGDGGRLVLLRQGSAVTGSPTSGEAYDADAAYTSGDLIGTGYVVYNGTGNSVSVTGLLPSTTYHYSIFEYNTAGTCYVLSGQTGSFTTASCSPMMQASNVNFSCPDYVDMGMNFSRGDGSHVLVIARAGSAVNAAPAYDASYTADANFGSGQQIGSGNYVVYNGNAAGMVSVPLTGLTPGTTYHFAIYEYNAAPNCYSTAPVTAVQAMRSPGTYTSSTVAQIATNVIPWTVDQQVVSLAIVVAGGTDAATVVNSITFTTGGSTSAANMNAAKIFYTGTTNTFSAKTQFGATVPNPSGTHVVTGSMTLAAAGTHYFWVAYDIIESPTLGNVVDATVPSFNLTDYTGTSDRTPTVTAPGGSRTIANPSAPSGYCTPSHNNSQANSINNVVFGGFTYTGSNFSGNYGNFTSLGSPTLDPGSAYTLTFSAADGTGILGTDIFVWIDWNQNGTFTHASPELVHQASDGSQTVPITVPVDATPGPTRMRITNYLYPATGFNSCTGSNGSATSGVTSDFTVTISGASSGPPVICSTPAPTVSSEVSYVIGDTPSQLSATGTGLLWYTTASTGTGTGTAPTPSTAAVGTISYYVSSTSGCESTRSQINVRVLPEPCGPTITTEPASSTVGCTVGNTQITVEATEVTTYQWQISTNGGGSWTNLNNGGKYSGATTATLNINNPLESFTGNQYQVIVSNDNGSLTSTATTLTVQFCPPNDNPAPNSPQMNSVNYVYPTNLFVTGTTTGATVSPETGVADVWYQFNAISNGVRIVVSSTVIDPQIRLCNSSYAVIDTEDELSSTGSEILNYGALTEGETYYVAVSSGSSTQGAFNISVQKLRKPNCGTVAPFSLCSQFKSSVTGATTTTFNFTVDSELSSVTSATPITLGHSALQLIYGDTCEVGMVANYALPSNNGVENISVPNPTACSIIIDAHPELQTRVNQRCATGAVLYRNSYLVATSSPTICGVTGYRVEFTQVSDCEGSNPQFLETFSKTITSPSASISLNYAFNQFPTAGYSNIGHWLVRWLPRFGSEEGEYGPAHVISVNGTAPAGMMLEPAPEQNGLMNTSHIAANIYPNPNNGDMVNLNMTGITTPDVFVRIMDAMGRVVYTNRYTVDGSLNTIVTFSKPLAGGLYMVEFTSGNEVMTQRMMVAK